MAKLYFLAFIGGVFYVLAAALDIAKIFYEFPFMESAKWILCIILRVILFILGLAGVICTWDPWSSLYSCFKAIAKENPHQWDIYKNLDPLYTMGTFGTYFLWFIFAGLIGAALETYESIAIRKEKSYETNKNDLQYTTVGRI